MKKLFLIAATTFFCVTQVTALPLRNPSDASLFCFKIPEVAVDCEPDCLNLNGIGFHIGYYGDFVFNRHLKTIADKHIDYSYISTNAAYLAVSFWEVFELFSTLGASTFSLNTSLTAFNSANPSPRFNFETSSAFSWSLGAQATLWQYRRLYFGVIGEYFASNPDTSIWYIRANINGRPSEDTSKYSEWQLGAGFSYRYTPFFVPYAGIKWSRALWEFNNQPLFLPSGGAPVATLINMKSSREFGYALGASFAPFASEYLSVTVEGRFGDETAFHVESQLRF